MHCLKWAGNTGETCELCVERVDMLVPPPPSQNPHPKPPIPEPSPSGLVYWKLTRPGFLTITAVAVMVGWSTAWACGCGFNGLVAAVTMALALMAHAAANVLNDHADACNGADAANPNGLFPFTGGSRLIQNGLVTPNQARNWGQALLGLVVLGGLWLALRSGPSLLLVGLAGVFLAWAYSYPPLQLMSRGLGELTVATVWWLVVVGADVAQRGHWMVIPSYVGVSLGLLVASILLVNGVPDADSDRQVGKRTLATRLSPNALPWVYAALALGAHGWLLFGVWALIPPRTTLWAMVSLPISAAAWWQLHQHKQNPQALRGAIVLTIASANLHGLALAIGMLLTRW